MTALHKQVAQNGHRRSLLVISAVKPFPLRSGQQVRVYNKLRALQDLFRVSFLTVAPADAVPDVKAHLAEMVATPIVLPSIIQRHLPSRVWHRAAAAVNTFATGLRASNYFLGEVELSPRRVAAHCNPAHYDLVLFEYWHTIDTVPLFRKQSVPCILDMHNVLWQSYDRKLASHRFPWMRASRRRLVERYRQQEEAAWSRYDALIAISEGEAAYARERAPATPVFTAPMGTDLNAWPYCWKPAQPPRLAYYGGLASHHNQDSVLWCVERILPHVWAERPDTEFWIVGANPPDQIRALGADPRVTVTGFVDDVAEVLSTMTAVLCPWRGTYGFRSRLVEVMALGVPVVATPDAVFGMGMIPGRGLFLEESDGQLAARALELLESREWAVEQSRRAREMVIDKFSFEATYGRLARELLALADATEQESRASDHCRVPTSDSR